MKLCDKCQAALDQEHDREIENVFRLADDETADPAVRMFAKRRVEEIKASLKPSLAYRLFSRVEITAEQLANLATHPVEIAPAPGPGKCLVIDEENGELIIRTVDCDK